MNGMEEVGVITVSGCSSTVHDLGHTHAVKNLTFYIVLSLFLNLGHPKRNRLYLKMHYFMDYT